MKHTCQKECYDGSSAYRLHHVTGNHVEGVTFLPLHYDSDVAVSWFRQGGGSVRIEGQYYPISTGDVILLNPRQLHAFRFENGYHDRITLYIREEITRSFPEPCEDFFHVFYHGMSVSGSRIPADTAEQTGIHRLLEQVLALSGEKSGWNNMLAICKIVELVSVLGQICPEDSRFEENQTQDNPLIADVLQYINQHYLTIPDADTIAGRFFLNKAYLCRLFKSGVGISLWNYVLLRRLMHSNDLISGGMAIEDACFQSGFQNYSNYFRLFKKYFGTSPSEFHR